MPETATKSQKLNRNYKSKPKPADSDTQRAEYETQRHQVTNHGDFAFGTRDRGQGGLGGTTP